MVISTAAGFPFSHTSEGRGKESYRFCNSITIFYFCHNITARWKVGVCVFPKSILRFQEGEKVERCSV